MKRKHILSLLCLIAMISTCVLSGCGSSAKEETEVETEPPRYQLYIDVDFKGNLLFAKYDLELLVDDTLVDTLPHGNYYTKLIELEEGVHQLTFRKAEDTTPESTIEVTLSEDTTFACTIETNKNSIDVIEDIKSGIGDHTLTVPDVCGSVLSQAQTTFADGGFINVTAKAENDSIWEEDNWTVISQSIAGNSTADKNDEIILTCVKTADLPKETESVQETTAAATAATEPETETTQEATTVETSPVETNPVETTAAQTTVAEASSAKSTAAESSSVKASAAESTSAPQTSKSEEKTQAVETTKKEVKETILKLKDAKITLEKTEYTYTGEEIKPKVTVTYKKKSLTKGTDYILNYKKNKNAGTASVTVTNKKDKTDKVTVQYKIKKAAQKISFKKKSITKCLGSPIFRPGVKLTRGDGDLKYESTDTRIATVTETGQITLKKVGSCRIKVTATKTKNYKEKVRFYDLKVKEDPNETQEPQVYVTATGKCYHSMICGKGSYTLIPLSRAKNAGLKPCSKCY